MTKIYNRYIGNNSRFYRVEDKTTNSPLNYAGQPNQSNAKTNLPFQLDNIFGKLSSFLPAGLDFGDILILLILLLLYIESKDEDFLIILAVLAFSIFKKD